MASTRWVKIRCPGCSRDRGHNICCDPCWARIPTNLPDFPRWRTNLRNVEAIHDAAQTWLLAHPERVIS
jgi:hypothetical protein